METPPPRLLLRAVRITLECILVWRFFSKFTERCGILLLTLTVMIPYDVCHIVDTHHTYYLEIGDGNFKGAL